MDYCLWLGALNISTYHYFSALRVPRGGSLSLGSSLSVAWALSAPGSTEIWFLASGESHPPK